MAETTTTAPATTEQKVAQPDAAKAASEAALKAQYVKDTKETVVPGGTVPKTDEVAAKAAADKVAADAKVAEEAAKKAATDKAAAEGKAPWDTSKEEKKEPTPEEKLKAESDAKAKADADKPYELKVPEGATVEPAKLTSYAKEMKDLGISQESAQKLLERDLAVRKANAEAQKRQAEETDKGWLKGIQAKWGDKFGENSELVKRGFDDFDPSGKIRAGMKAAGLTNWPEVIEAMERHGRRIQEDKLFTENAGKTKPKMGPEEALREQYRKAAQGK